MRVDPRMTRKPGRTAVAGGVDVTRTVSQRRTRHADLITEANHGEARQSDDASRSQATLARVTAELIATSAVEGLPRRVVATTDDGLTARDPCRPTADKEVVTSERAHGLVTPGLGQGPLRA